MARSCFPYSCSEANPDGHGPYIFVLSPLIIRRSRLSVLLHHVHPFADRALQIKVSGEQDGDVPVHQRQTGHWHACEKMRRGQRRCVQGEKGRVVHGRVCDAARRRHGDVSCSSGHERSFDIQLIRDRNRDSSESASRFETGSGRGPRSRVSVRLMPRVRVHVRECEQIYAAASRRQVSRLSGYKFYPRRGSRSSHVAELECPSFRNILPRNLEWQLFLIRSIYLSYIH